MFLICCVYEGVGGVGGWWAGDATSRVYSWQTDASCESDSTFFPFFCLGETLNPRPRSILLW